MLTCDSANTSLYTLIIIVSQICLPNDEERPTTSGICVTEKKTLEPRQDRRGGGEVWRRQRPQRPIRQLVVRTEGPAQPVYTDFVCERECLL